MSGLRLLEDHLYSLESLLFVSQLSSNDVIVDLSVLTSFVPEVIEHLFWSHIVSVNFLNVHETLSYLEKLMLTHLYHLAQFPLFLVQSCIVFLLLPKLGCCLQEGLEVSSVASVFEQVYLGQELLLLLFKLSNLLLEFCRIHALVTKSFSVLMDSLELSLQVFVTLKRTSHLFIDHVLIRYLERDQEFCSVGFAG